MRKSSQVPELRQIVNACSFYPKIFLYAVLVRKFFYLCLDKMVQVFTVDLREIKPIRKPVNSTHEKVKFCENTILKN